MKRDAATKQPSAWEYEVPATTRFRFRHQYDDRRDAEERALTDFTPQGESKTVQSHAEDADINVIIRRMGLAGVMPPALDLSFYQDASNLPDLRAVLEYGRDAEAAFQALPPSIRNRFHNSPAELWDFVMDENNREEAIRIGLIDKKAPEGSQGPTGGTLTPPETKPTP